MLVIMIQKNVLHIEKMLVRIKVLTQRTYTVETY